jgi:hypothetical protein
MTMLVEIILPRLERDIDLLTPMRSLQISLKRHFEMILTLKVSLIKEDGYFRLPGVQLVLSWVSF